MPFASYDTQCVKMKKRIPYIIKTLSDLICLIDNIVPTEIAAKSSTEIVECADINQPIYPM